MNRTALHSRHLALGAKMTDFHDWDMPLYYTSILEEHKAVRQAAGLFDISHMGQVLVTGPQAAQTLNAVMVSDITQVGEGRACYTLMLNEAGGILDDLIVYRIGEGDYLVIVNCSNRAGDVAWLQAHREGRTTITDISQGRSILALQGPLACRLLEQSLDARVAGLGRFEMAPIRTMGPEACIARTGYTGGDGFELFLQDRHAQRLWDLLLSGRTLEEGVQPVGLGARDTLRIEAGLRLYGADLDTTTSPFEAGLDWTVALNKGPFIGQEVLLRQKREGLSRVFIGFELSHGPVPRGGMELKTGAAEGEAAERTVGVVTSGTFSPLLNKPLGLGYVEPSSSRPGTTVTITVRSQRYAGTVVKLPFWRPTDRARASVGAAPAALSNPQPGSRDVHPR
ncbi:MAG: glycine cleavage system aminomethyltransferase GcvT [Candidatus Omnitrophota bacterium]|nr:glycine cleavage system aminomethyltransferase GcvT [Candidatus Omnitrophota bacterium]